jgi:enoyl-CoA hydratase/carnithine racemase
VPAAKLGLGYPLSGLRRLVDLVGPSFAKEIFFTAKRWSTEEARIMGLTNRVVPNDALEAYVLDYAKMIAGNAPLTVGSSKAIINEALKDRGAANEEMCDRLVKQCFASEDYIEGRRAFMEKRPPQFKGR